jgi:hypothetical protein
MRRSFGRKTSGLVYVALALGGIAGDRNLSGQTRALTASPFKVGAGLHETRARWQNALQLPNASEVAPENKIVPPPPPTRSSFMATWPNLSGAKGYLLDVSTSSSFNSFVDGYHNLDVGEATGRVVTGLRQATTYYYRVRPYDVTVPSGYSETMSATTEATTGLVIHATFDSSITGNPNSAAIQATINQAISICESLLSDPITIEIRFRYSTTEPNGDPIPADRLAQSNYVFYTIAWNTYINALRTDARTGNDNIATASLPGSALSANILPASAAGRAIGLDTPPAMFADGTVGDGGPYDGIVTLNSASPYQFTRPPIGSNYDAQRSFEHEMDEVIGLGSHLNISGDNLRPQDLFSWSSAGNRNTSSSGTRYFSINGGVTNIVNFNQDPQGDFGDWLSGDCPQPHPYVQNAFACTGQSSDVTATSPEGINLDVVGYDLMNTGIPTPTPMPTPTPPPAADVCYSSFTTAEGCDALNSLTTGAGNTALGWRSLFLDSTGSFNTGVGGGALVLNNGSSNTAVGAAALLLNITGNNNTAVGTDTLVFNDSGSDNTATGYFALMNNTTGGTNTAIGSEALIANTSGNNNTAIGNLALQSSQTTSDHVAIGTMAGSGITTANNNIIIGHHSGVHSVFGQESDRCFIDNIFGAPVSAVTAVTVMVDSDGRLGTVTADGPTPGGFSSRGIRPPAIPDAAKQATLNLQVQDLEATVARNQQQIEMLTAQVKEQAARTQKVNTQLEIRKPAAKVIVNESKAVR